MSNIKWKESNRALNRLIRLLRSKLEQSISIAERIRQKMDAIFPLMEELRIVTCPWCPEPCCIVNKVWFDFQDLLFLHLMELQIPPSQLTSDHWDRCCYLSHRGCMLPRIIRPWACTLYICAPQMRILQKRDICVREKLDSTIRIIRIERQDMEAAFNRAVLQKHTRRFHTQTV